MGGLIDRIGVGRSVGVDDLHGALRCSIMRCLVRGAVDLLDGRSVGRCGVPVRRLRGSIALPLPTVGDSDRPPAAAKEVPKRARRDVGKEEDHAEDSLKKLCM